MLPIHQHIDFQVKDYFGSWIDFTAGYSIAVEENLGVIVPNMVRQHFLFYTLMDVLCFCHFHPYLLKNRGSNIFTAIGFKPCKTYILHLKDGTRLQRRASSRSGVTANREALMYSLVLDGGISYMLLRSLRNLFGSKSQQKDPYTEGYQRALQDMQQQQRNKPTILHSYAADPQHEAYKQQGNEVGKSHSR